MAQPPNQPGQQPAQNPAAAAGPQQPQYQPPLLAVQFQQYLDHDRQVRAQESQNARVARQESDARQKADTQVKRVPKCDGSTPTLVREWLREVTLTANYSDKTVYIASQSATGAMRREIEHFLDAQPNRHAVTWPQLRAHLEQAFLSPHEDDKLRHEVEQIKQAAYETTASYGRRFREAADLAYPAPGAAAQRNADQTRLLLRAYMRGLRDRRIVERLVREGRPADFSAAMTLVQAYEADDYRLHLALNEGVIEGRMEEPMEIGAVGGAPADPPALVRDMAEIRRQVNGLTTQFTRLMATLNQAPPAPMPPQASGGSGNPRRRDDRDAGYAAAYPAPSHDQGPGPLTCNYCHRQGHIARNCRRRLRNEQKRSGPGSNGQNQGGH